MRAFGGGAACNVLIISTSKSAHKVEVDVNMTHRVAPMIKGIKLNALRL